MMEQKVGNLFEGVAGQRTEEIFDTLLETENFRIERIVSQGQNTPKGEWLEQKQAEWVVLLKGATRLSWAQKPEIMELKPGDYVHIPANCKHRVEWTDPKIKTVWLALHYNNK